MIQFMNRPALKAQARELLRTAQVTPKAMTALYLGLCLVLDLTAFLLPGSGVASQFVSILTSLAGTIFSVGFILYCMGIRRMERMDFSTIFDGFSFVSKIIALNIVISAFTLLWSMLFLIPGLVASYRYRFAFYNLCENPDMGVFQALALSKQQTRGYKMQLFNLDLSYLGWALLASLPQIAYVLVRSLQAADLAAMQAALLIDSLPLYLFFSLWSLVVSLFYLPNSQCVELDYFEAGKATAAGFKPEAGSDSMGGF